MGIAAGWRLFRELLGEAIIVFDGQAVFFSDYMGKWDGKLESGVIEEEKIVEVGDSWIIFPVSDKPSHRPYAMIEGSLCGGDDFVDGSEAFSERESYGIDFENQSP